jgi:hypothetical protein
MIDICLGKKDGVHLLWAGIFLLSAASAQSPPMVPTPLQSTPADVSQQAIRQARSALFDNIFAGKGVALESRNPLAPGPVGSIRKRDAQELPASISTAVVIGTISSILAYQSSDHRAIYTEEIIQLEKVLSDEDGIASVGGTAAVVEVGGSITLPNGRVLSHEVVGRGTPFQNGGRYAFFITYVPQAHCYKLTKAWALLDGKASAMSPGDLGRVRRGASLYNGMPESAFVDVLMTLQASYQAK